MRLQIKGLAELRERLARLNAEEILGRALAEQAERLAEAVRDGLSQPAGAGGHDRPWVRSGALRDSIEAQSNGLSAAVGSNDPAAAPQEMGTSKLPPRPFLAPTAAGMGESLATATAETLAAALRGEGVTQIQFLTQRRSGYVPVGPFDPEAHELLRWLRRPQVGPVQPLAPALEQPNIVAHEETRPKPPADSKPIDETPWSGDHGAIKKAIGAKGKDDVNITPDDEV